MSKNELLPENKNEKTSYIIGVIAICFAAIGAAWSFLGGICCGWAGWGYAFIGLVLSIVSLAFKKSNIGWWALGLSIFAFAWLYIYLFIIAATAASSFPKF